MTGMTLTLSLLTIVIYFSNNNKNNSTTRLNKQILSVKKHNNLSTDNIYLNFTRFEFKKLTQQPCLLTCVVDMFS